MIGQTINNRYHIIAKIGQGGMGSVWLAHDRLTDQDVALKQVTLDHVQLQISTSSDTQDYRLALAQEFKTLSSLRHPHVIGVIDYGFDESGQPFFTSEYLSNARDLVSYAQSQPREKQVRLMGELLEALAYLHRRQIIHRDLKPDNVLVVNGTVKVLDFGLAVVRDRIDESEVVGTLMYMAPEVLQGAQATVSSDLYAVGMMAYELFAGVHPFAAFSGTQLVLAVAQGLEPVQIATLDADTRPLVSRLLANDPGDRFERPQQVITEFNALVGKPPYQESDAILESFLQAAAFVGRDNEFEQLSLSLTRAGDGQGSTWLIGGESGVGKSRLMDEVRTHALVEGALVLRGQATREGGAPYGLMYDPLRRLLLQSDLDDLSAGVIKTIVPDIDALLGRPIALVPNLGGQNQNNLTRLLNTVEDMFRQQKQTIVLLLEDLHWASESLSIIDHLSRIVRDLPLMIVGNYRNDEMPDLPNRLPDMQQIKLERLDESGIEDLSRAILGEAGQKPQVIDFLQRETEGNVFFAVEVIRALAAQTGRMDRIGEDTLPAGVFSGGIRSVIQLRLNRLPNHYQLHLEFAAVAGRAVDLKLVVAAFPDLDIDDWLLRFSDASVLEVNADAWRFSHDKVREVVLQDLQDDAPKLRDWHRQVAEALDTVYPESTQHHALRAYHRERAIDPDNPTADELHAAMLALAKAARLALDTSAYRDAYALHERLMSLDARYRQVAKGPGEVSAAERAEWHYGLAESQVIFREQREAIENFETAMRLLGHPMPQSRFGLIGGIVRQIREQRRHRRNEARYLNSAKPQQVPVLRRIAQIDRSIGGLYFINNKALNSLYTTLRSVNLGELAGPSPELAQAYGQMVVLVGNIGRHEQADRYAARAEEVFKQIDAPTTEAFTRFIMSIYYSGMGNVERVRRDNERARELFKTSGDDWQWGYASLTYATSFFGRGDFARAYTLYQEIEQNAIDKHIDSHVLVANAFMARIDLIRDDVAQAVERCDKLTARLEAINIDPQVSLNPWAFSSWVYLHAGEEAKAYTCAETAYTVATQEGSNATWGQVAFTCMFEVYMALRARQSPVASADTLLERAGEMVKFVNNRPTPNTVPGLKRIQGWQAADDDKLDKALQFWEEGLSKGRELGVVLEQMQTCMIAMDYLPDDHPDRATYFRTAVELGQQYEMDYFMRHL